MASSELAIDGGKRVRMRSIANPAWTKKREQEFFAVLAASCNVAMAARAAGVRPQRAYERRQKDAAFRKAWEEAIAEGYARLELALLERALVGTEKVTVDSSGKRTVVRDYPNNIAMSLLKMHRETARAVDTAEAEMAGVEEARERILERLERLAERQIEDKSGE